MSKSKNKKRLSTKNNQDRKVNAIPDIVFWPFNRSKKVIISMCVITVLSALILIWNVEFKLRDLKELAEFVSGIVLVMGTIGIAIFAIPFDESITNTKENKKEVMLRYVGSMGVAISITFFAYIVSIVGDILDQFIIKILCLTMLISLVTMITSTFASIVAYFNIRN